jgi:hypothetical protein
MRKGKVRLVRPDCQERLNHAPSASGNYISQMLNLYSGNATTDAFGNVTVALPA